MTKYRSIVARALPCGASWRYSRFAVVRRVGDWWLPLWGSLAFYDGGDCSLAAPPADRPPLPQKDGTDE